MKIFWQSTLDSLTWFDSRAVEAAAAVVVVVVLWLACMHARLNHCWEFKSRIGKTVLCYTIRFFFFNFYLKGDRFPGLDGSTYLQRSKLTICSLRLLLALGNLVSLFGFLSLLGANTPQLAMWASLGDSVVSLEALQVFGQLHSAWSLVVGLQRQKLAAQLSGLLDVLLWSITLPRLLSLEREEDQLGLVLLEALSI